MWVASCYRIRNKLYKNRVTRNGTAGLVGAGQVNYILGRLPLWFAVLFHMGPKLDLLYRYIIKLSRTQLGSSFIALYPLSIIHPPILHFLPSSQYSRMGSWIFHRVSTIYLYSLTQLTKISANETENSGRWAGTYEDDIESPFARFWNLLYGSHYLKQC